MKFYADRCFTNLPRIITTCTVYLLDKETNNYNAQNDTTCCTRCLLQHFSVNLFNGRRANVNEPNNVPKIERTTHSYTNPLG